MKVSVLGVTCCSAVELVLAFVPFQNWESRFIEQFKRGTYYVFQVEYNMYLGDSKVGGSE